MRLQTIDRLVMKANLVVGLKRHHLSHLLQMGFKSIMQIKVQMNSIIPMKLLLPNMG